uniref:Aminotransferase n=1 Tax=Thermorudis sp. TaxID=1969470 RepID=A0A7C2WS81_9BACT
MGDATRITPSRRARQLPPSPIRALAPLAEAAKRRGVRVIHLNIGQPDLPPPPCVVEALAEASRRPLVYAPARGLPETVDGWCTYYRRQGIEIEPEEVLVTSGASEALWLALLATTDPGDEVLVPEPFYAPYQGLLAAAGLRLVPVPPGPSLGPPDPAELRARVTPRTRAILLCSPANPSGAVWDRAALTAAGELACQAGLYLLSDETYREIVFDGPRATSVLELPGLEEHALVIDSLSKRFNVCGLRIGALATRNRAVMAAALELAELRLALPVIDQLAVTGALAAPRPYVDQVVAAYRARRDAVLAVLAAIPGVEAHRPGGAFYIVAGLPVDDAERFAAWLLAEFEYRGETVMVTPMRSFYATPGAGRDEVRLALVHAPETLVRAVEILGAGLAAYPGRTA